MHGPQSESAQHEAEVRRRSFFHGHWRLALKTCQCLELSTRRGDGSNILGVARATSEPITRSPDCTLRTVELQIVGQDLV
jgi:hypothetical protein